MRDILSLPAFTFLCVQRTEASAEDCGAVCTWNFWENSTQQEIEEAIRSIDVNATGKYGNPLHYAAGGGTSEIVTILLEGGAEKNARNRWGETPIFYAARRGAPEIIQILFKAGADVNTKSEFGQTPLHYAARWGTPQTVRILLDSGADGAVENNDGQTPFSLAADNENLKGTDAYRTLNYVR
jgi:ankyrin repeat protein